MIQGLQRITIAQPQEVQLLNHLRTIVSTARTRAFKIIFVPHHRWQAAAQHPPHRTDRHDRQYLYRVDSGFGVELGYHVTLVKDALTCISLTLPVIVNSSLSPVSEALPNTSGWRQRRGAYATGRTGRLKVRPSGGRR